MQDDTPSATAILILKAVLFAAEDPLHHPLVDEENRDWSRRLALRVIKRPQLFLNLIKRFSFRVLIRCVEGFFAPGFILHVACRKRWIKKTAIEQIAGGIEQCAIVGAGFDTLSLSICKAYPHVTCFEIDHPATQRSKSQALGGVANFPNLHFIAADLAKHSLTQVLASQTTLDREKKCLIIVEGVLMYLAPVVVENFFSQLRDFFHGGCTCIFTFMNRAANGSMQFRALHPLVNWWLASKHEPFLWGIEKELLPRYLTQLGFVTTAISGKPDFLAQFFPASRSRPHLADGEWIARTSSDVNSIGG